MRICTTIALALALATAGACKKDNQDSGGNTKVTDNKTDQGSGTGSTQTPPPPPEPEKPLDGPGLAKRYVECSDMLSAGEFDKFMGKCLAADAKMHDAGMGMEMKASDVVPMFTSIRKGFPDLKMSPQFVFVNGRTIAAVGLMSGTHSGELDMTGMGMGKFPATNKKIGHLYFHRLKVNDENKTTEEWFVDDGTAMMQMLGVVPADVPTRPAMEKGLVDAPVIVIAADNDVEKANLAAWKKGTEAMNAHKAKDAVAMFADDGVESDQAEPADTKGKKDIQKGTEMFIKAFPDLKIEALEEWAAGDYVVFLGTAAGTNTGPLGKMKKTGKAVKIEFAEVAEMKDGKISKLWRFRSGMSMAMQLGLIPPPPAPGAAPADPKAADPKAADPKGGAAAPAGDDKKAADPAAAPTGTKADDKKADTK